jgi:hypothetical protein
MIRPFKKYLIGFLIGILITGASSILITEHIRRSRLRSQIMYQKKSDPIKPTAEDLKIPDHPTYSAGMPSPDERPDLYLKCEGPRYTGKVSEASKSRVIKFD